ncbi:MAG: nicotinate-nicotinamide nucleotide adenylyltransferase [Polyangiaceae bacterium]|nr:nicotinate-nicotinamide nucleotide adenylyltransferase [Polyangiaceae bacterium]
MNVGVFGGSFNPPHMGHLLACVAAKALAGFDRILIVPTFKHPFAKVLAPYEHRIEMCRLLFSDLPFVEISRIEEELGGESRTLRTLQALASRHPTWKMRWICGADILQDKQKWHAFEEIEKLAPPFYLGRIGAPSPYPEILPGISSSKIREQLKEGAGVGYDLPEPLVRYIETHSLYAQ